MIFISLLTDSILSSIICGPEFISEANVLKNSEILVALSWLRYSTTVPNLETNPSSERPFTSPTKAETVPKDFAST